MNASRTNDVKLPTNLLKRIPTRRHSFQPGHAALHRAPASLGAAVEPEVAVAHG